MPDKYFNYAQLREQEMEGLDYVVRLRTNKDTTFLIIAPHGGKIEPFTSEIADYIAGEEFLFYSFEGIKESSNNDLHLTSHNFDEPRAMAMIHSAHIVVAIHGEKTIDESFVILGGLEKELIDDLVNSFSKRGIMIRKPSGVLTGEHPFNICNRGQKGKRCPA